MNLAKSESLWLWGYFGLVDLVLDGDESLRPRTLAFDIGASSIKATVLDGAGRPIVKIRKRKMFYPCTPHALLDSIVAIADQLPTAERFGAGFPGLIRSGRVLTATNLVTLHGPGSPTDSALEELWLGYQLEEALAESLAKPGVLVNDADLAALAVSRGRGLEVLVTLGSGFGSALVSNGRLSAHLEMGSLRLGEGVDLDGWIGEAARKSVGDRIWEERVHDALAQVIALTQCDHLYVGGGNAPRLHRGKLRELFPQAEVVESTAGMMGAFLLF